MKGRVNTGGGGSGGTLTVTGIAGHTVTATKDGKTYTRTFNSSGVAVFKGLSTGTWTLTMTDGEQEATRTVEVNADYEVTITYFSATINITYPAGSTCKATHTDGTVLNAPDTSGTWACVVPKRGTWTILAEDTSAGKSKSVDVSITAEGQSERVVLTYELVLFDNGSYDDVTGGWSGIKNSLLSAEGYSGNQYEDGKGYFYTQNKIDLSDYMVLHFMVKQATGDKLKNVGYRNSQASDTYVGSASVPAESSTPTEYTVDVSSQTGSYYIGGHARGTTSVNSISCSKVWLT